MIDKRRSDKNMYKNVPSGNKKRQIGRIGLKNSTKRLVSHNNILEDHSLPLENIFRPDKSHLLSIAAVSFILVAFLGIESPVLDRKLIKSASVT